jgi:hypothetical protein
VIVGHGEVVERLRVSLPPVALILGPRSVGKWTIAEEIVAHHGIGGVMLRRYAEGAVETDPRKRTVLKVDDARSILAFISKRTPQHKAIIARLDHAQGDAVNALLKALEEPPPKVHFLLVAAERPLLTIVSRSQVFRCGYLTEDEVTTVLVSHYGLSIGEAEGLARCATGQLHRVEDIRRYERNKGPVLSVLKGAAEGNEELFMAAVTGKREVEVDGQRHREDAFGEVQWSLLRRWAVEAMTGRWRMFTPAESFGLQNDARVVRRVLRLNGVRPKIGAIEALLPIAHERGRRAAS